MTHEFARVGVVGCGTMGSGICEIVAQHGLDVAFVEVDDEAVERGLQRIQASLAQAPSPDAEHDPDEAGQNHQRDEEEPCEIAPCPGLGEHLLLLEIEHHELEERPYHAGDDHRADRCAHHQERPRRRPFRLLRRE